MLELVAAVPGQDSVIELLPALIVTPGDVDESPRLSVIAIVHPEPGDPGTVNVADHVPLPALKPDGVDDPEQPPPHVADDSEDGVVPTYVPLPATGEPPTVPLASVVKDIECPPPPTLPPPWGMRASAAGAARNNVSARRRKARFSMMCRHTR